MKAFQQKARGSLRTKLKPAVPRHWLPGLAGLMWSAAGVVLCRMAYNWLLVIENSRAIFLGLLGILLAIMVYRFGFSKMVRKNMERIGLALEWSCIFAFQSWKSYLIVGLMISMGVVLRRLPLPRYYLAVLYLTMGGALCLSSIHYYSHIWRSLRKGKKCERLSI